MTAAAWEGWSCAAAAVLWAWFGASNAYAADFDVVGAGDDDDDGGMWSLLASVLVVGLRWPVVALSMIVLDYWPVRW